MDIKEIRPVTVSEQVQDKVVEKVTDHVIEEIVTKTVTDGVTGEVISYKEINTFKVSDLKRSLENEKVVEDSLIREIEQLTNRLNDVTARRIAIKQKIIEATVETDKVSKVGDVLSETPINPELPVDEGTTVPK